MNLEPGEERTKFVAISRGEEVQYVLLLWDESFEGNMQFELFSPPSAKRAKEAVVVTKPIRTAWANVSIQLQPSGRVERGDALYARIKNNGSSAAPLLSSVATQFRRHVSHGT